MDGRAMIEQLDQEVVVRVSTGDCVQGGKEKHAARHKIP
jgi:hypothetical protein